MIKDMRTGMEKRDVQNVLDGELDDFLESSLMHFRSVK
jgi:protein subunit release factor B